MSANPAVLALHFLLELAALGAVAYWGWTRHEGIGRWLWSVGLALLAAVAWATFRVEGDGGDPLVVTPGRVRLVIELLVLGGAALLLSLTEKRSLTLPFAGLVMIDYALSYDRVQRLLDIEG